MEAQRRRQLPPIDVRHVKARDLKLWKCDEVHAHVTQVERYLCFCSICLGACPLKQTQFLNIYEILGNILAIKGGHKYDDHTFVD
jgi:hypothetical protein